MSRGQSAAAQPWQLIYRSFCGARPATAQMGLRVELDLTKVTTMRSLGDHHVPSPECSLCIMLPPSVRSVQAFEHLRDSAPEQTVGVLSGGMPADSSQSACHSIGRSARGGRAF